MKNFKSKLHFILSLPLFIGLQLSLPDSSHAKPITDEFFEKEVLSENEMPVIVEFSAKWCGPCKNLEPVLKDLEIKFAGKVKLAVVDGDQNRRLITHYRVFAYPHFLVFFQGEIIGTISSYDKARIESAFEKAAQIANSPKKDQK